MLQVQENEHFSLKADNTVLNVHNALPSHSGNYTAFAVLMQNGFPVESVLSFTSFDLRVRGKMSIYQLKTNIPVFFCEQFERDLWHFNSDTNHFPPSLLSVCSSFTLLSSPYAYCSLSYIIKSRKVSLYIDKVIFNYCMTFGSHKNIVGDVFH